MQKVRNHVRAVALIWLLGQVASLSAFVPENCCVSHVEEQAAKAAQDDCHESEPAPKPEPKPQPGDACPMQHDTGAACPMHSTPSTDRCVMTNACDGPGTNLISLFAFLGAIERPVATAVTLESSPAFVPPSDTPTFRFTTPDAPPPKA